MVAYVVALEGLRYYDRQGQHPTESSLNTLQTASALVSMSPVLGNDIPPCLRHLPPHRTTTSQERHYT